MFLRNFDNIALLQLGYGIIYSSVSHMSFSSGGSLKVIGQNYEDGNIGVKLTNGSTAAYKPGDTTYGYYINAPLALNKQDICLGDGSTEVTYDDYKLSGNVVQNKLVKVSSNVTYDNETKEYTTTLIATYTNSETEAITIREWGMFATNQMSYSGGKGTFSNTSAYNILTYREVLDEPVVIEAGTTATLTFQLKVSLFHQA